MILYGELVDNGVLFFNFGDMGICRKNVPEIDEKSCTGCGGCEDVCGVEAISMRKRRRDDPMRSVSARVAHISETICNGCGDCVGSCGDIYLLEEGMEDGKAKRQA